MLTHALLMTNTKGMVVAIDNTLTFRNGTKFTNAQHKLFSISEKHPIAIMSLGTNFFINAPLEPLIQQFAATIDDVFYNETVYYVNHFISFIEELETIDLQEEIEERNYIISFINNRIEELHENLMTIKNTDVTQLQKETHMEEMDDYLHKELNRLENKHYLEGFTVDDYEEIVDTYGETIIELIEKGILDENVARKFTPIVKDIVIQALLKDIVPFSTSMVFVGFGQKEIYPTICELQIEGRVNRKVKFSYDIQKMSIEDVLACNITSFAHARVPGYSFTTSIDQDLEEYFFNELHEGLQHIRHNILESIKEHTDDWKEAEQVLNKAISDHYEGVKGNFEQYKKDNSLQTIVRNLNHLSLEQLAYHAESLLHFLELKKNINHPENPLGISANVAMIDRVDGFTLMK